MAKGTKLSEFEKGDITVRIESENLREISKALGCGKTVICNYLISPNNYGTRKPTGRSEKLSPHFKRIFCEVKKKTQLTSEILKSLVDAPCRT